MAKQKTQPFILHLTGMPLTLKFKLIWALIESIFGMDLSITFYGVPINERDDPNSKAG